MSVTCKSADLVASFRWRINIADCSRILSDQIYPKFHEVFYERNAISHVNNARIQTTKIVSEWYKEHFSGVDHLLCLSNSPDLNIIEYILCIIDNQGKSRYCLSLPVYEVETVSTEEWTKIHL